MVRRIDAPNYWGGVTTRMIARYFVEMPEFSFEHEIRLNDLLASLGMGKMVDPTQ